MNWNHSRRALALGIALWQETTSKDCTQLSSSDEPMETLFRALQEEADAAGRPRGCSDENIGHWYGRKEFASFPDPKCFQPTRNIRSLVGRALQQQGSIGSHWNDAPKKRRILIALVDDDSPEAISAFRGEPAFEAVAEAVERLRPVEDSQWGIQLDQLHRLLSKRAADGGLPVRPADAAARTPDGRSVSQSGTTGVSLHITWSRANKLGVGKSTWLLQHCCKAAQAGEQVWYGEHWDEHRIPAPSLTGAAVLGVDNAEALRGEKLLESLLPYLRRGARTRILVAFRLLDREADDTIDRLVDSARRHGATVVVEEFSGAQLVETLRSQMSPEQRALFDDLPPMERTPLLASLVLELGNSLDIRSTEQVFDRFIELRLRKAGLHRDAGKLERVALRKDLSSALTDEGIPSEALLASGLCHSGGLTAQAEFVWHHQGIQLNLAARGLRHLNHKHEILAWLAEADKVDHARVLGLALHRLGEGAQEWLRRFGASAQQSVMRRWPLTCLAQTGHLFDLPVAGSTRWVPWVRVCLKSWSELERLDAVRDAEMALELSAEGGMQRALLKGLVAAAGGVALPRELIEFSRALGRSECSEPEVDASGNAERIQSLADWETTVVQLAVSRRGGPPSLHPYFDLPLTSQMEATSGFSLAGWATKVQDQPDDLDRFRKRSKKYAYSGPAKAPRFPARSRQARYYVENEAPLELARLRQLAPHVRAEEVVKRISDHPPLFLGRKIGFWVLTLRTEDRHRAGKALAERMSAAHAPPAWQFAPVWRSLLVSLHALSTPWDEVTEWKPFLAASTEVHERDEVAIAALISRCLAETWPGVPSDRADELIKVQDWMVGWPQPDRPISATRQPFFRLRRAFERVQLGVSHPGSRWPFAPPDEHGPDPANADGWAKELNSDVVQALKRLDWDDLLRLERGEFVGPADSTTVH